MSNPFSIMLDESNDKIDKSCIILVRVLDPEVGNVCTRFLDMPVVNRVDADRPRRHPRIISLRCYENNSCFILCRAILRWDPKETASE